MCQLEATAANARQSNNNGRHAILEPFACQAALVPCIAAGVFLLVAGRGLGWIVPGVIGTVLASVLNAWVLLVEIQR